MSTTDSAPAAAKGSPALLVLFAVALIPTFLVGNAVGAGPAAVVGGLVALFSLIAFLGGPLRADLQLAAAAAPVLLVAAVVPRLVGQVSRPVGIALVTVIVFLAALLPLRGPRFVPLGLGLGMVTLFTYGIALTGPAGAWQVVVAVVTGLVIAVVLRVLFGITDPSGPTRAAVAAVLDADDPAPATAVDTWRADGRRRWLGLALGAASRYRLALHSAEAVQRAEPDGSTEEALTGLRARAGDLAECLRAKRPGPAEPWETPQATGLVADAAAALDAVARAVAERDPTPVPLDTDRYHRVWEIVRRPPVRLRSIQVRHALRTAVGIALILTITAYLPPGDPLVATALVTTFGILQASWRETFAKARPRIIGLVGGAASAVVIILLVPPAYLTAVALVALCAGLWNMTARPAFAFSLMVLVTVGFNTSFRHADPVHTLIEYAALTLVAVVIGVVVGFVVVPGLRPEPLHRRIVAARSATFEALRATTDPGRAADPQTLLLHRAAAQARADLTPDRERLDDQQLAELDRFRTALRDLTALGAAVGAHTGAEQLPAGSNATGERRPGRPVATGHAFSIEGPAVFEPMLAGLAEQVRAGEQHLLATLPDLEQKRR